MIRNGAALGGRSLLMWAALFIIGLGAFLIPGTTSALSITSPIDLSGYAWSSNIGWISMSCEDGGTGQSNICASNGGFDYGVQINPDGTLSGYAWSSNIGWIQFGGLSGCPAGSCAARLNASDTELLGWARALSYGGGWDGWISLSCANTGCGGGSYRVGVGATSNSYAWGGEVVGWIDFSGVIFPGLSLTFTASPNPLPEGDDTTLSWDISGIVDSCYANSTVAGHNWTIGQAKSADTSVTNTQVVSGLMNNALFTLRCDGPGGTFDEQSVLVDVVTPPTAYLEVCRWDGSSATDCVTAPDFLLIAEGDAIRLGWSGGSEASTTCQAIAGKDFDTNGGEPVGTDVITTLTTADHPETYTVECTHPLFAAPALASVDVHVGTKCAPLAGLEATELVRAGSDFTLSWQKPVDIADCVITGGSLNISADPSEPSPDQCAVIDEPNVRISNKTQFTMSCNYPPDVPRDDVGVIPRMEEI